MNIPVFTVDLPQYHVGAEPDHVAVGKVVDAEIRRHLLGRMVVVRGIGAQDHPGKTVDDLVDIIKRDGTDRYDPTRKGDRYENIQNKQIELFAFWRKVTPLMRLFQDISWGFYHSAIAIHGRPTRIDILIIYDATKLKVVVHQYEGRADKKRDGFVFREPTRKSEALLGIVRIR
ncbi:hypothetical protein [Actinopolymorpha alba]|uniref:hypothetical protein n=1 Tax=Actinopolymorpha alba TaxID=533267 RepID=UPI0012F6ECCB|nr:hypothetical protein [Actinopolymorpha alba]